MLRDNFTEERYIFEAYYQSIDGIEFDNSSKPGVIPERDYKRVQFSQIDKIMDLHF